MKTKESIYETFTRTICSNCINSKQCKEELRQRIDNTIKCDEYKSETNTKRKRAIQYWQKW